MLAYYVIKTVREPMILADGSAELKSYAAAGQALALMVLVPLYGWLSTRVSRARLLIGVMGFFFVCIQLFYLPAVAADRMNQTTRDAQQAAHVVVASADTVIAQIAERHAAEGRPAVVDDPDPEEPGERERDPHTWADFLSLGFIFYVWVGIFSLATIAQFWGQANELYSTGAGERLFALIGVGATVGAATGSLVVAWLFDRGFGMPAMLQITAAILIVHTLIGVLLFRLRPPAGDESAAHAAPKSASLAAGPGGFALIARNPYLRGIALLLLVVNLVNTTGEYVLSRVVREAAVAAFAEGSVESIGRYIGSFYGRFFFFVNIATVTIQAFLVSRLVRLGGVRALVLALPLVAFGVYGLIALGAGYAVVTRAKGAENATDYSIMNTAKAMLWLPTTAEEKYKAKQACDTFVVRFADVISAGVVLVGTAWLSLSIRGFATFNLVLIAGWVVLALWVARRYRALARASS